MDDFQPLSMGNGVIEDLKLFLSIVKSPLDESPEGIKRAAIYYSEVIKRINQLLTVSMKLEPLLTKGRPILLGKEKWDHDVFIHLAAIRVHIVSIFGSAHSDKWLNSALEVPDGCGRIWYSFYSTYRQAMEMVDNMSQGIADKDNNLINKGLRSWNKMNECKEYLRKEVKTLEIELVKRLPKTT